MNIDMIKNNSIIITNVYLKNKLIEEIRNSDILLNINFMTMDELRYNLYFSYDEKAVHYIINKYNVNYDIAIKYLNNLYYLNSNNIDDKKIKKLIDIKQDLDDNNLLYYNSLFIKSLFNKDVIIYNYKFLNKFDKLLIEDVKKISNVIIYNDDYIEYEHKYIYECNDIEEEINFVAIRINNLINDGISINDIKICGVNNEYNNYIKKIFGFYNIPITFNDSYLYATTIAQDFLNNMSNSFSESLEFISNKYNLKDEKILNIYNSIVNIVNKYVFVDNLLDVKDMIINDFKNKKINIINLSNEIVITNSLDNVYDKYVFLMNFSQGMIPNNYKDEDYLNDELRDKLCIDTSSDLNKLSHDKWLYDIKHTKNIFITYKKNSPSGDFYLSSLNDKLNLEIKKPDISYNYSNIYNRILLTNEIDNLVKYNLNTIELELLYNNYKDVRYMEYNNNYVYINRDKLKKYINNKLVLSYSAINNYYHCSFKYYISNILKLNIFDETFYTIIGNLFHYILSICFDKEVDIEKEYYDYIGKLDYKFDSREKFFLDNLLQELIFVINTIKKQYEYSSLDISLYEDKIEIDKSKDNMKIIFKGFVDKIMLDSEYKLGTIIDYKTGNPTISLNNSIYGLDLQLPVYVYLTKYKFPNIRIIGFYLQKILNSEVSIEKKKSYLELKEDKLKLQGYTNKDENIISLFDNNYNNSKIIKGMRTSSKGIQSKKVLDDVNIDHLINLTEKKIDNAIDNILDAKFDINPKRVGKNNLGCLYCKFKDICFMREEDIVNLEEYKDLVFLSNN